jgi:zinc transporter ZupT
LLAAFAWVGIVAGVAAFCLSGFRTKADLNYLLWPWFSSLLSLPGYLIGCVTVFINARGRLPWLAVATNVLPATLIFSMPVQINL